MPAAPGDAPGASQPRRWLRDIPAQRPGHSLRRYFCFKRGKFPFLMWSCRRKPPKDPLSPRAFPLGNNFAFPDLSQQRCSITGDPGEIFYPVFNREQTPAPRCWIWENHPPKSRHDFCILLPLSLGRAGKDFSFFLGSIKVSPLDGARDDVGGVSSHSLGGFPQISSALPPKSLRKSLPCWQGKPQRLGVN